MELISLYSLYILIHIYSNIYLLYMIFTLYIHRNKAYLIRILSAFRLPVGDDDMVTYVFVFESSVPSFQ